MLEYWNNGTMKENRRLKKNSQISPSFQYSTVPIFLGSHSNIPVFNIGFAS
jgi:hypothetical protein